MVPTTPGHQRKFARGLMPVLRRKARFQSLRAHFRCARSVPAAMEKSRKSKKIASVGFGENFVCKHHIDLAEKRCEAAQIHLVVAHNSQKRPRGSAAQIIKIKLRDVRRRNVISAMPAEALRAQNIALELHKPHRA